MCAMQEHFARKRLEAITGKDGDPTSTFSATELVHLLHSQDLMFLNSVAISNDGGLNPALPPRPITHIDPDNRRRRKNRQQEIVDVELPLSPPVAAKPSLLELDLSTSSEMSFYADPQPRVLVSTLKVPRKPFLKNLEPPAKPLKPTRHKDETMALNLTDSLMMSDNKKEKSDSMDAVYKLLGIAPDKKDKDEREPVSNFADSSLSRSNKEGFSMFPDYRKPRTLFDREVSTRNYR